MIGQTVRNATLGPTERQLHEDWLAARKRLHGAPTAKAEASPLPAPLPERTAENKYSSAFRRMNRIQARPRIYLKGDEEGFTDLEFVHLERPMTLGRRIRLMTISVALKHGVSVIEMLSVRRDQKVVRARHELMFRLYEKTTLSLPQIGRAVGNKDHTTVLNGIRRHKQRMAEGTAI